MATVQIRNLDDQAYGVLKTRAAASGRSLQEYVRILLEETAASEPRGDFWKRYRADMSWAGIELETEDVLEAIQQGRR